MLLDTIEKGAKNIVFVYTTCRDWEEAHAIGLAAIEGKLAVASDFWEMSSIYPWHGVIQDVNQHMLMLTTEMDKSDELIKFIGGMHSYTTPMITRLDTALMNPTYRFWVEDTLRGKGGYMTKEEVKAKQELEDDNGYHFGKLK